MDVALSAKAERFLHNADSCRLTFYTAFVDYSRSPTRKRFRQMTRALTRIERILAEVGAFGSPDYGEGVALRAWFSVYVRPFVTFWKNALAKVEAGKPAIFTMTREVFDEWELPAVTRDPSPPNAA